MFTRFNASTRSIAPLVILTFAAMASAASRDTGWMHWRGPNGCGVAPNSQPPTEWSADKNVKWKVALSGEGLSTPIVWENRVYIQAAIAADGGDSAENDDDSDRGRGRRRGRQPKPTTPHKFTLMAFDRDTGKTVWERTLREVVPHEGSHRDGSLAPASPVTDGEHIFAYFGSRGLYCLTMDGKPVWDKDLGDMQTRNGFGEGASPALHGDTLVVNWDHEGDSFIVAFDKSTGKEKWRKARDEPTSWSTPLIIEDASKALVVVSASNRVRAYDIANGDVVWECGGLGLNGAPTPAEKNGILYVMSGYREPALLAIRYGGATGDLTGTDRVVWTLDGGTPYVPSPLVYGDWIYTLQKNSNILSCFNAADGEKHYTERLDDISGVYSSIVGAGDRVYVVGRNGVTYVLRNGPKFETLSVNRLDDEFSASPAIVGNQIFLRGMKNLYCIGN